MKNLKVSISGMHTELKTVCLPRGDIVSQLNMFCPTWYTYRAFVISAQTGSGKTRFVHDYVIPKCRESDKRLLYVSSRIAIEVQQKVDLAKELGEEDLLRWLTPEGWRAREEVGNVTILTYHRLIHLIESKSISKGYDYVVFDEVHALLSDAMFSPKTGWLLEKIPQIFCAAQRIYLSATPEDVLPYIAKAERVSILPLFSFAIDYSYLKFRYFTEVDQVISQIQSDTSTCKWLVFVRSIRDGMALQEKLGDEAQFISSETKLKDSQAWNQMLDEKRFTSKVLISTSVIDAGVNLIDDDLRNIVSFSSDHTELVQQVGRKRVRTGETVTLYLHEPTVQSLQYERKLLQTCSDAFTCRERYYAQFISLYILGAEFSEMRASCYAADDGSIRINSLAKAKCANRLEVLTSFLQSKRNGENLVAKMVHWFGRTYLDLPACWIDPVRSEQGVAEFQMFLDKKIGIPIEGESAIQNFCDEFRQADSKAFGKRKGDRSDRTWGATIIRRELECRNTGIKLITNDNAWLLKKEEKT